MKSGMCAGRNFILKYPPLLDGDEWFLTMVRQYDKTLNQYFPNTIYPIKSGDRFVITDIQMPRLYVEMASQRLYDRINGLKDYFTTQKHVYSPEIDDIQMQRWADDPENNRRAISEGMYFNLNDEDIMDSSERFAIIDTLTIDESSVIPHYSVTLRDEKRIKGSSAQGAGNAITTDGTTSAEDVSGGGSGSSEGGTMDHDKLNNRNAPGQHNIESITGLSAVVESVTNIVKNFTTDGKAKFAELADKAKELTSEGLANLRSLFLSKTEDDTAKGNILFEKSARSDNFIANILTGKGWGAYKNQKNEGVLETDNLIVRKEMKVNSLVVNQITYIGGMRIGSAASIEVSEVEETEDGIVCRFNTRQGSLANHFQVDDVAMGMAFDSDNLMSRYFKRRVVAVDEDSITLSITDVNGSGMPEVGDVIVHYGSYTNADRQYAIVEDVIGGGYTQMLADLDSVDATGREYYFAGKDPETGMERWFVGDNSQGIEYKDRQMTLKGVLVQNDGGFSSLIGVNRGTYSSSSTYYPNDTVTYTSGGSTATYRYKYATPASGKTPTNTTYWEVVAKGANGSAGANGNYTQYRYKADGSKVWSGTVTPSEWSTTQPALAEGEYLWMIQAQINGTTGAVIGNWSSPVRITPYDGGNTAEVKLYQEFARVSVGSVVKASGASYGFTQQSDGYWMSSNKGVNSSASVCVVTLNLETAGKVYFDCVVSGEASYDYGLLGKPGQVLSNSSTSDSGATQIRSSSSGVETRVVHEYNLYAGETKIYVKYRKDSSGNSGGDYFKFKVLTSPSLPSGNLTYSFSTGVLSGTLGNWSQTKPSLDDSPIWEISARAISESSTLVIKPADWKGPVISSEKGSKGDSPAMTYQDVYDGDKIYYGNPNRRDAVKFLVNGSWIYRIATVDADEKFKAYNGGTGNGFYGIDPTNTMYWNDFGAQFGSIATGLVLADRILVDNLAVGDVEVKDANGTTKVLMNKNGVEIDGIIRSKEGNIAGFELKPNMLSYEEETDYGWTLITRVMHGSIDLFTVGAEGICNGPASAAYRRIYLGGASDSCPNHAMFLRTTIPGDDYVFIIDQEEVNKGSAYHNTGLQILASGNNRENVALMINNRIGNYVIGQDNDVAIRIGAGICEGIRHKTLVISTSGAYSLTNLDHIVIVTASSGTVNINITNAAHDGQELVIVKQNACSMNLNSISSQPIVRPNKWSYTTASYATTERGTFTLRYVAATSKWWYSLDDNTDS